jgi:hypothetical protein
MADNLGFNPHTGEKFATDDVDGIHHIRVKLQAGADGTAADISDANPLPVSGDVSVSGSIAPATGHTLTGTPPVSQAVLAAPTTYLGVEIRETTGTTAATVVLYDNASAASGTILGTYSLLAGESRSEEITNGRAAANGIYAAITGTVQCTVFAST